MLYFLDCSVLTILSLPLDKRKKPWARQTQPDQPLAFDVESVLSVLKEKLQQKG